MITGLIFDIAHYTIHDGPGIRTTVFLKGCPARCLWCCSPQSQSFEIEQSLSENRVWGRRVTPEELFAEVRKDAPFWRRSGGGVTLSGGEVMAQPDFVGEFLDICRRHNVHTAIETCLCAPKETVARITSKTDFIQFDIKIMNSATHEKLTSLDNKLILENALCILKSDMKVLVRFLLVPGVNDFEENIREMGAFLESARENVDLEVLAYHRMGVGIYEELGRIYHLPEVAPPTREEYSRVIDILNDYRIKVLPKAL